MGAVDLKRELRGQCQISSSDEVRISPISLVGNMSAETVGEEPSSVQPEQQQQRSLPKNITAKVVTQLTNVTSLGAEKEDQIFSLLKIPHFRYVKKE